MQTGPSNRLSPECRDSASCLQSHVAYKSKIYDRKDGAMAMRIMPRPKTVLTPGIETGTRKGRLRKATISSKPCSPPMGSSSRSEVWGLVMPPSIRSIRAERQSEVPDTASRFPQTVRSATAATPSRRESCNSRYDARRSLVWPRVSMIWRSSRTLHRSRAGSGSQLRWSSVEGTAR